MDISKTIHTKTAGETARLGETLASDLVLGGKGRTRAVVLCLYGDLGSGKTTFAQGFARGLGYTGRLLSPTFIIVRRYQINAGNIFLYHVDLYRTKTQPDIENLGFSEMIREPNTYILIEWAEKLGTLVPGDRTDIVFSTNDDATHTIKIS